MTRAELRHDPLELRRHRASSRAAVSVWLALPRQIGTGPGHLRVAIVWREARISRARAFALFLGHRRAGVLLPKCGV